MKIEVDKLTVTVTLSRRNLQTMLAKLDGNPPGSFKTITKMADHSDYLLVLRAEEDAPHYGSRGYGPGEMHPNTETALARRIDVADTLRPEDHALVRIVSEVEKVINAREMARYLSPGDKAQPVLADRLESGLDALTIAFWGMK